MDLIERKYRILQAIIDDYILTALPVGSRTISKKYEQNLSSATIRNEMSDLEDLGYLDSPHTSAGRVPSNKAYRLYVDRMLQPSQLSTEELLYIQSCFDSRIQQVELLSAKLARAISGMTNYTTAVVTRTPRAEQQLSHLQLVPVSDSRILMVLVTQSGAVKQHLIDIGQSVSPDTLFMISQVLSNRLAGCPLDKLSASLLHIAETENVGMQDLLRMIAQQPEAEAAAEEGSIVIGGRSNLLAFPEYADVGKAKELLKVLETKDKLLALLNRQGEMEITVRIGPETGMEELKDCSVVTASYRLRDGRVNTIGLIGPTRMRYGKVLAVLDEVGKTLGRAVEEQQLREGK